MMKSESWMNRAFLSRSLSVVIPAAPTTAPPINCPTPRGISTPPPKSVLVWHGTGGTAGRLLLDEPFAHERLVTALSPSAKGSEKHGTLSTCSVVAGGWQVSGHSS